MKFDYVGLFLDIFFLIVFTLVSYAFLYENFKEKKFFIYWAIPLALVISYLINDIFDPVSHFYTNTGDLLIKPQIPFSSQ